MGKELLPLLDATIEAMKIAAALAGIAVALTIPWMRKPVGLSGWKRRIALVPFAICSLAIAGGTGSCVLGGFIQGSGFCSHTYRGVTWDPVADFYAIQAVWSFPFLFTAFFFVLCVLSLLPGPVTGWQRFLFLATAGKGGAWRETPLTVTYDPISQRALAELDKRIAQERDPARKAEWMAAAATVRTLKEKEARFAREMQEARRRIRAHEQGFRSLLWLSAVLCPVLAIGFLFPALLGAFTQETLTLGGRVSPARLVSLGAEPVMFWFSIAASLVMSALMARLGLASWRSLRAPHKSVLDDTENEGVLIEIGKAMERPR